MNIVSKFLCAGLLAACLPGIAVPASAEIEKTADISCGGICTYVWPKIIVPAGWEQDIDISHDKNINFIHPVDGPDNAGIYASALTTDGQADSVEGFIADDRAYFAKNVPGLTVSTGPVFKTQDGQSLASLSFTPTKDENWDITAYGAETDADGNNYYLTFTLSVPSKALQDQYLPVFTQIIAAYHK